MNKIKHLFDYKKGEVITEGVYIGEDEECDCDEEPCICEDTDISNIDEDSEGEETYNYGEESG